MSPGSLSADSAAPSHAREPERILIVDDDPANLKVLLQALKGQGFELLVAKRGEDALKIAARDLPHLVILDVMMPGIDGYETCRRLRQEAATLWYHPHALGRTGEHVYRGLAGLFIIEDDLSDARIHAQRGGDLGCNPLMR